MPNFLLDSHPEDLRDRMAFLAKKIDQCADEIIREGNAVGVPEHELERHQEYIDDLINRLEAMELEYSLVRSHLAGRNWL